MAIKRAWAAKSGASKCGVPVAVLQAFHSVKLVRSITNFALNGTQAQIVEMRKEQGSACPDSCVSFYILRFTISTLASALLCAAVRK
jgi:hypothetical protein